MRRQGYGLGLLKTSSTSSEIQLHIIEERQIGAAALCSTCTWDFCTLDIQERSLGFRCSHHCSSKRRWICQWYIGNWNWEYLHGDKHTQVSWPWFTIHIQDYSHWLSLDQASWVNLLFMIQFRVSTEFTKTCRSSDRTGTVHPGGRKWPFSSAAV